MQNPYTVKLSGFGIPDREEYGDPASIPTHQLLRLIRQKHDARRAGTHEDIRLESPEGYFSWATRKGLPGYGEDKRMLFQQPLHNESGATYEGEIPSGYGAGRVTLKDDGEAFVTRATENEINLVVTHKKHPEYIKLVKRDDKQWLSINYTPQTHEKIIGDPELAKKVRYKNVKPDLPELIKDYVMEAKISGSSGLIKLDDEGVKVLSYRNSRIDGRPIIHTERVFGTGAKDIDIPKELRGLVLRGEVFGESGGKYVGETNTSSLLNSSVSNALRKKQERDTALRIALFDVAGDSTSTYDQKRELLERVQSIDPQTFTLPENAKTLSEARELYSIISSGKHKQTDEGVIWHPRSGEGAPMKSKLREDADVYIQNIFSGTGKYSDSAGGFEYSLEPDGPVVGKIGSGFNDDMRRDMRQNPDKYRGRVAKIHSIKQLPSGAYYQPSFIGLHEDRTGVKL